MSLFSSLDFHSFQPEVQTRCRQKNGDFHSFEDLTMRAQKIPATTGCPLLEGDREREELFFGISILWPSSKLIFRVGVVFLSTIFFSPSLFWQDLLKLFFFLFFVNALLSQAWSNRNNVALVKVEKVKNRLETQPDKLFFLHIQGFSTHS